MGIREFVMKPLTKKDIAELIRNVLDGNQMREIRNRVIGAKKPART